MANRERCCQQRSVLSGIRARLQGLRVDVGDSGPRFPLRKSDCHVAAKRGLGYANRPNFDGYCFGSVHATTNENGFRGKGADPSQEASGEPENPWFGGFGYMGHRRQSRSSFLGRLESKFQMQSQDIEVINAGVVGYSSVQEMEPVRKAACQIFPGHRSAPVLRKRPLSNRGIGTIRSPARTPDTWRNRLTVPLIP